MSSSRGRNAHAQLFGAMDRAAIDPTAWPDVCDGLADVAGAAGTMFVPFYGSRPGPRAARILPAWRSRSMLTFRAGPSATISMLATRLQLLTR